MIKTCYICGRMLGTFDPHLDRFHHVLCSSQCLDMYDERNDNGHLNIIEEEEEEIN